MSDAARPHPFKRAWGAAGSHPVVSAVVAAGVIALGTTVVSLIGEGAKRAAGGTEDPVRVTVVGGPDTLNFRVAVAEHPPEVSDWLHAVGPDGDPLRWAEAHGGAEAGSTERRLVIEGRAESTVVTDLRARIVARHDPAAAIVSFSAGASGFGEVPAAVLSLGDPELVVRLLDPSDPGRQEPLFETRTLSLAAGETQTLDLLLASGGCDCSFELVLTAVSGGRETTMVLRDRDGDPFRLANEAGVPTWSWRGCPETDEDNALVYTDETGATQCLNLP